MFGFQDQDKIGIERSLFEMLKIFNAILQVSLTEEIMSNDSPIEWTDRTWNPLVGCSRVSEGCKNCYAATIANTPRMLKLERYQKVAPWDGTVELVESVLSQPLKWRKARRVFVCSMSDIFHDNVEDEWLYKIFAIAIGADSQTFQVLTKRADRMKSFMRDRIRIDRLMETALQLGVDERKVAATNWPPNNVWLGVTVENQRTLEQRVPALLACNAKVAFLSCEPLLEKLHLDLHGIDWAIVGGESGLNARHCRSQWIADIVTQCAAANTPVFVKQLGSNSDLKVRGKGNCFDEFPASIQIREFPFPLV